MISFIVGDASAVIYEHAHRLRHVHGASAAESHNTGCAAAFVEPGGFIDDIGRRVRDDIKVGRAADSCGFNNVLNLLYHANLLQAPVGDQEHVLRLVLFQDFGKLF